MSKYDDIAKQAAADVNADLAAEKEALLGADAGRIARLLPDEGDRDKLNAMIEKVKAATSSNEAAQAYKEFAKTATESGVRAVGEAFKIGKKLIL